MAPLSAADTGSTRTLLLAIESSCDETAAAVIDRDRRVRSSVVATQTELHAEFGGVVPEIASRAHLERILPVVDKALRDAGCQPADIGAIAVATTPGLVGSLLVGLTAAKTLAWVWDVPLIAVDHLHAHLYACRMAAGHDVCPAVGFVVSGGHTNLYDWSSINELRLLGSTIDDAAGEAFDKVAQILGLGFPGGPALAHAAQAGRPDAFDFPRTFLHEPRLEFSFSGLKTAVLYAAKGIPGARVQPPPLSPERVADLAASFQQAVVDVLIAKIRLAIEQTGYRRVCLGGGVVANQAFREALTRFGQRHRIEIHVAPWELCTDNAAMHALGWELWERGITAPLDLDVLPGLVRAARS